MRFGSGPGGITLATLGTLTVTPGPMSRYGVGNLPDRVGRTRSLAVGHLLGHVEQEPTVRFFNATHQPAELAQKTRLFPGAAPNDIVSALALRKIGEFGWFLSVIEKLIKGDFQSARHLFQCFNGRNAMAVFYAGNVQAQGSRALLDIPFGEL